MLLLHNTLLRIKWRTAMFMSCCRSAGTARSVAQDAHGRARDFGDSAGKAVAEARDSAEQTGRDTARKGAQGTRWAAEEVHGNASSVGQSVGQLYALFLFFKLRYHDVTRGLGH